MKWISLVAALTQLVSAQSSTSASTGLSPDPSATASRASAASVTPSSARLNAVPSYDASRKSVVYVTKTEASTSQGTQAPSNSFLDCPAGSANMTGPFCLPLNGTQQIKNKEYSVTWDSSFAPNCSSVYVALLYYGNEAGQLVTSTSTSNSLGFWNYTVQGSWLESKSTQEVVFQILPYDCSGDIPARQNGPIIQLRNKVETTVVSSAMPKDRILGLSIGLPLALLAFLGTVLLVFWWNKQHRQIPQFSRKRRGYTGRKERGVRLQEMNPDAEYRD
ncbi:hypothetical protein BCR37DRAFT_379637 [Protomyces lactucae-debilis]|uniref:Uncharacterized protein n=1 Tax=Protomyces lactucae-debilis TaxID=2754530 RepID=A0A1Y2FFC8_PROLT|nr:uncharacterized protein BCR37DRAFT_379637 [Protomyces lactucae-debilis]ORY82622.1 hypothetical protein BCR37DRAFT_379637 [Protomyces lactucae-debilis]